MSNDLFEEVSSESWLSRLGGSLVGVLVGIVLCLASLPVLFWNEGRSVREYRSLREGAGAVVSVDAGSLSSGNEGKLVHLTAITITGAPLKDTEFGVTAEGVKLRRIVESFQWKESSRSESQKKLGGGQETKTTYEYEKVWSEDKIDSKEFKQPQGHENPTKDLPEKKEVVASAVTLGGFKLSPELLELLGKWEPLPVSESTASDFKSAEGELYRGADPKAPQVGDVRIRFEVVKNGEASVVAKQVGDSLAPYATRAGGTIALLEDGKKSAAEMFTTAREGNGILTWILRVVGFLMLWIGLASILRPLSVLADVLPFVGNLVGAGTGFAAFLVALALSSVTVAIAWFAYRPLISVPLLAVAAGGLYLLKTKARRAM